ncbi:fibronectin type III domain-containing protein 11 [Rana temporaria]|uniref:fibronectin type III domain-containing protein 11 n=1 Tax=Rana temporaria TaxID=8407 RepID=UPI001AADB835|nr:fibronectin type III domain-containing protein 11 [Rana temporaria]
MAEAGSNMDTSSSVTSVNTEEDIEERPAVSNCREAYLRLIDDHMSMDTLGNFEHRLELLRKSSFFIDIVPKKILFGLQYVQNISTMLLLDPARFKQMKEIGREQTVMQLFLLEKYLEELKRSRAELVEMVPSNDREFSLTKQGTLDQNVSGLKDLVDNFKYMLVSGPLYIKNKLISPTTFHHLPSLRMFLNTKGPVMFDRSESMAFDNWTFLSWHVSGHRLLTDSFEVHFQQLNLQSNEEAHSGVHTVEGNTLHIDNLLPEKTYQFSIRRTKTCNQVYDEWCDIITLITREI